MCPAKEVSVVSRRPKTCVTLLLSCRNDKNQNIGNKKILFSFFCFVFGSKISISIVKNTQTNTYASCFFHSQRVTSHMQGKRKKKGKKHSNIKQKIESETQRFFICKKLDNNE